MSNSIQLFGMSLPVSLDEKTANRILGAYHVTDYQYHTGDFAKRIDNVCNDDLATPEDIERYTGCSALPVVDTLLLFAANHVATWSDYSVKMIPRTVLN